MDNKVLLKGAYSEVDQPAVRSIGKRTPDHWSERVSPEIQVGRKVR